MSDNRTTAEKLAAEAETESRVATESALAHLRGRMEQLKADGIGDGSLVSTLRYDISMLRILIEKDEIPFVKDLPKPVVLFALDALVNALPAS